MRGTGVYATKKELEHLKSMVRSSGIMLHIPGPSPQEECHRIALEHGLPEIPGYYGIKGSGEFVVMD